MAYVTYYLKYRPQKVSELDSTFVREALEKILKAKKIPHAFLFSGPKGTGKTSAARIFAKSINCIGKRDDFEPCNQCEVCQEITNGSSLDLIEIDAASNRGIDDIRNLREKIKLSPVKCQYKVYIIDEVHMLTTEAFNALLKTLEEPPAHAIFILCTTAPEKLPKTIISRCLQIKFQKAKKNEVINSLERVVKGENLSLEKGVLEEIAATAEGSFRDAQKILDQLALGGRKITLKEAQKLVGRLEEFGPYKLLMALSDKDVKASLLEIDKIVNFGADLEVYSQMVLESLRWLLLKKSGLDFLEDEDGGLEKLEDKFEKKELLQLISLFNKAALEIKTSIISQLPLELAVVEWCEEEEKNFSPKMRDRFKEKPQGSLSALDNSPKQNRDLKAEGFLNLNQHSSEKTDFSSEKKLDEILEKWNELLAGVKPLNHSVEALLRAARPIKLDGGNLTLEVFYKFHKERLETDRCRSIVEEVATQILGLPIKLKCVLGQKKNSLINEKIVEEAEKNGDENDIMELASGIFNGKIVD